MDQRNPIVRRSMPKSQRGRFDGHPLVCGIFKSGRVCMAGARCPFAHKIPRGYDSRTGLDNPRTVEWLASNVYMGAVDPPIDQTLKTIYLRRLNSNVNDQQIRERFRPYGEIESIVYFAMRGIDGAFLTYKTRQAAEKAMLEHSSRVLINGENVKLLWGAHVIPKIAVVQKNLTPPPKDSKPLNVYARKRKRSNNGGDVSSLGEKKDSGGGFSWVKQDDGSNRGQLDGGGGFDWSKQSNNGGEGPSFSKEGDGVSKQLGEPSAGGDDDGVQTSGEADNALGAKPNAGASSSSSGS